MGGDGPQGSTYLSPRLFLKGSFKGDIDIGMWDIDSDMAVSVNWGVLAVPYNKSSATWSLYRASDTFF